MRPEKLILEGVYSYKNRTEIDFETLCAAELFGIFGNVGSGKSAVLESVTYVLYGRIERLSNRVYYNMMNLASDRMYIDFTFSHKSERYRFTFETKRSKKDFDKIDTPKRSAYRQDGEEWIPLFDKDKEVTADDIIGLNYDNFRRTIIVPQGRFQEFLHLEKKKRTDMLMELFRLGRFNLFSKAASLAARNNEKTAATEGELNGLGEATEEAVNAARSELDSLAAEAEFLAAGTAEVQARLKAFEELSGLCGNLAAAERNLAEKQAASAANAERKQRLQVYEDCRSRFKSGIDILDMLGEEQRSLGASLEKAAAGVAAGTAGLEAAAENFRVAEEEYGGIEKLNEQAGWYEQLAAVEADRIQAGELRRRIDAGRKSLADNEAAAAELAKQLAGLREAMGGSRPEGSNDIEEMNRLAGLYRSLGDNTEQAAGVKQQLEALTGERAEHSGRLEGYSGLEKEEAEAEARIEDIRRRKIDAEILDGIGRLAENLQDGSPCPVCGSTEHPAPAPAPAPAVSGQAGGAALEALATEERTAADAAAVIKRRRLELQQLLNAGAALNARIEGAESTAEECEAAREALIASFPEGRFGPDDAEAFRTEYESFIEASRLREKQQQESARLADRQTQLSTEITGLTQSIHSYSLDLASAETRISSAEQEPPAEFLEGCRTLSAAELSASGAELRRRTELIKHKYREADNQHREAVVRDSNNRTGYEMLQKQSAETNQKAAAAEAELVQLAQNTDYEGIEEIRSILQTEIDVDAERAAAAAFDRELAAAEAEVGRLNSEIGDRRYDAAEHESASAQSVQLKNQAEQNTTRQGELGNVLRSLTQRLERRKILEAELQQLIIRSENLSVLKNLFRANKFIDYAATVYLHELCEAANARFRKLTRESLRLELDENNNFIIRDYLNDGKTRSVKTLSGGQTFQAAFSLSLALADSIGRERSGFFFLDEGFGSLDRESLTLVFDSLKSLKKEERTVGIISHVEELKQEIDTFISVSRDNEEGSMIKNSWN